MNHFHHITRPVFEQAKTNNIRESLSEIKNKRHAFERATLSFGLGFLAGASLTLIIYSTLFG